MKRSSRSRGFTLLELLIALFIFSVMATLAYGGLRLVMDGDQRLQRAAHSLSSMQRAILFLQQDLTQLAPRAIRDEYGSHEAAFISGEGEQLLRLTRGGIQGQLRGSSDLIRVEYELSEGQLVRKVWPVLDRVQGSEPSRLRLIDGVVQIEFQFMGNDSHNWESNWPSPQTATGNNELPRAVEVKITTEGLGQVTRLIVVGS